MCAQDVNSCENTAYRLVDIFSSSLLHLADDFLRRWIDRRECFARDGIDELIVDEQLRLQFGNLNKSHDEFVSLICLFVLMIRCCRDGEVSDSLVEIIPVVMIGRHK